MKRIIKYTVVWLASCLPLFAFSQGIYWKVKPVYDEIQPFHEGVAVVKAGNKYGYIDQEGKVIVPISFDMAYPFRDGIGVITQKDRVVSYLVDKTGKMTVPQNIFRLGKHAVSFSDGLLPVSDNTGLFGYIDKNGTIAIPCRYADALPFHSGLAAVYYSALPLTVKEVGYLQPFTGSSEGGFINKQGLPQIKPHANKQGRYCFVSSFSDEGLAVVSDGKRYYFISAEATQKSNFLSKIEQTYNHMAQAIKGKFKVSKTDHIALGPDKHVASYTGGFIVFNPEFQVVTVYGKNNEDLIGATAAKQKKYTVVTDIDGLDGIDFANGAKVLPQFQEVTDGGEDWATVKQNDRYGVIGLRPGLAIGVDVPDSEVTSAMGLPAPVIVGLTNKWTEVVKNVSVGIPALTKETVAADPLSPALRQEIRLGLPQNAFGNAESGVSEICVYVDSLLVNKATFHFRISTVYPLQISLPKRQTASKGKNTIVLTLSNTGDVPVPDGLTLRVSDYEGEIFSEALAAVDARETRKIKIPFQAKKSGEMSFTVSFWQGDKCVSTRTEVVTVTLRKKSTALKIAPI